MHVHVTASLVLFTRAAATAGFLIAAGTAAADTYVCALAAPSSASNVGQLNLPLNGTLIGNYDATTNPGGTQTRPGLFGGSGNNPINFTSTIVGDAGFSVSPTGTFTMELTPMGGCISGLELDLTGGIAQEFGITLNINYQTFRTFAPNSTFIGGFTIPIPLAGGEVSSLIATQTGPAPMIVGMPDPDGTPFMALVPVDIVLNAQFTGVPIGGEPQAAVLPLMGRYTVQGSAITISSSLSLPEETVKLPALPAVENQPLPLPTILPPGGTANLLLNGTISGGTYSSGLSATLFVEGELEPGSNGDINGDGTVNAQDLSALLAAWGSAQAAADLDDNGVVNGVDLAILLANWG
jgi:hypothetical protein